VAGDKRQGESMESMVSAQKKQKLVEELTGLDPIACRQRALNLHQPGESSTHTRPVQIYRLGAKHWLIILDNQISTSLGWTGLAQIVVADTKKVPWREWHQLVLSTDRGSDGLCAIFALLYKFLANLFWVPDESHDCKNTLLDVLRALGLMDLWLLLLIDSNIEHGPRDSEERRALHRSKLGACYRDRKPHQCPAFMADFDAMARELETFGGVAFPGKQPLMEEVWEHCRIRNSHGIMGRRTCMARYGAALDAQLKGRATWSIRKWERSYICLEDGLLTGKRLDKITVKETAASAGSEEPTGGRIWHLDAKALRHMDNAVVISHATLVVPHHHRAVLVICEFSEELTKHHTEQNRKQRSVGECREWQVDQICGGFERHLEVFLGKLTEPGALLRAGFQVPFDGCGGDVNRAFRIEGSVADAMTVEDEYASLAGQCCVNMIRASVTRGMWRYGYPARCMRSLGTDASKGAEAVKLFVHDMHVHDAVVRYENWSPELRAVSRRHVAKTTPVIRLRLATDELGPGCAEHPDWLKLQSSKADSISATQVVEDINGIEAVGVATSGRKYRKQATLMASVLARKDTFAKRHRYDMIDASVPALQKSSKLAESDWAPVQANTWTSQGPPRRPSQPIFTHRVRRERARHTPTYRCFGSFLHMVPSLRSTRRGWVVVSQPRTRCLSSCRCRGRR